MNAGYLPLERWRAHGFAAAAVLLATGLGLGACGDGEPIILEDGPIDDGPDIPPGNSFGPPVDDVGAIADTFNPRWRATIGTTDFHRGIDFVGERGDPIYAIGDGVVHQVFHEGGTDYPGGGNVIIAEHELEVPFEWLGTTVDTIYAFYLHLDSQAVAEGDPLTAGQQIGGMGDSGVAETLHLHFEIRLQTTCTYSYQTEHPESSCAQYGFDPHVHPFPFIGGANSDGAQLTQDDESVPLFVYETDRTDLDLNQIVAELPSGGGTINFNRRTGMDASSEETLDDLDYGWLRIVPRHFNQDDPTIAYELHFAEQPTLLEITDVYGKGMRRVW